MTATIKDAEGAYLYGNAELEEWKEIFMANWFAPLGKTIMGTLWNRIDPETHAALRQRQPAAYDVAELLIGGKNGKS